MTTVDPADDSDPAQPLGGRLPLLRPDELSSQQRRLYDRVAAEMVPWADKAGFKAKLDDGRMIGPFNTILFSPAIGDALLALQAAEQQHTSLDERMRQVVILTVGAAWKCDYERYAHAAVAGKAGLSAAAIGDLSRGVLPADLAAHEMLAQRVAWQLAVSRAIESKLYAEAQRVFDPKLLVDLIALAGIYGLVCGLLNGFAVPAPPAGG